MKIGEVAASAGVSVRALRYYEEQGLLHSERTRGGQRVYEAGAVGRVRLLQQLYSAGLTSSKITELLPCVDAPSEHTTAASVAVMREEYARLSAQIDELIAVRAQLGHILEAASAYLDQDKR
ncbi:MerR family transcriptional regulator [Microbacterium sp. 1P10AE]|uniref:MerR family transcriptional regulator n=1 Tax=Microbacterium sp. 1P10AE TaxID=3132286 RepID=UPI0039A0925F